MTESSGPNNWNQKIIEEFHANAGKVGGYFEGAHILLIHHTGARSGKERVNPLTYLPDGDDMIIAATKSGAPTNPDWYYNLKKHPRITVEVGTATFPVDATEVTGEERNELVAPARRAPTGLRRVRDQDITRLSDVQIDAALVATRKSQRRSPRPCRISARYLVDRV